MSKGRKTYEVEKPNKFVFDIYVDNIRQNEKRKTNRKISYDTNIKQYFLRFKYQGKFETFWLKKRDEESTFNYFAVLVNVSLKNEQKNQAILEKIRDDYLQKSSKITLTLDNAKFIKYFDFLKQIMDTDLHFAFSSKEIENKNVDYFKKFEKVDTENPETKALVSRLAAYYYTFKYFPQKATTKQMIKTFNETTELFKNKPNETYDLYILSVLSHAIGNKDMYGLEETIPTLKLSFYPYSKMHVKSMSKLINQVSLLKDDTSKKIKKIYPKNIAMLFAFFFDERNMAAIDDRLFDSISEIKYTLLPSVDDDDDKINLLDYIELNNGIVTLTEKGNVIFSTFLQSVFLKNWFFTRVNEATRRTENKQSTDYSFFQRASNWFSTKKNKTIYKNLLKIQDKDLSQVVTARFLAEPSDLFFQTYKFVCERQEEYFQTAFPSYFIPYVLSDWQTYSFYRILPIVRQSLANLKIGILKKTGELYCEPCKEGYEIFKGRTNYFKHDKENGYNKGYCVQTLISLLNELGLKGEDCKTCKWFVNWVGSQEAAQRRIDNFIKEQEQRSLNSDPRYNILNYYITLIRLKIDLKLKQLLELTEKSPSKEDLEKARQDTYFDSFIKSLLGENETAETMIEIKNRVADLIVVTGLVLYKLVTFIVNQPFFMEMMLVYVKSFVDDMCIKLNVREGKAKILKTTDDKKSVKEFKFELGEFQELSEEESKQYFENKINSVNRVWANRAYSIYEALSNYVQDGKWKQIIKERQFMNSNLLDDTLAEIEKIYFIGPIFKKVGRSKVKNMIQGYLITQGQSTYESIIKLNQINQFQRFATMFYTYYTGNCGRTVIMDGIHLSVTTSKLYEEGFYNALYNIPYYALMILVEESYYDQGVISGVKGEEDASLLSKKEKKIRRQKFIEMLIVNQIVGGNLSYERERQAKIWKKSGQDFADKQKARLNEELKEYKRRVIRNNDKKMTLADTVAYRKQIEERFNVDVNTKLEEQKNYEETKKQFEKEDSSYFNKKRGLWIAAAAVTAGGIACYLYPPCAAGAAAVGASTSSAIQGTVAATVASAVPTVSRNVNLAKDIGRSIGVRRDQVVDVAKSVGLIDAGSWIFTNSKKFASWLSTKTSEQQKKISGLLTNKVAAFTVLKEVDKKSGIFEKAYTTSAFSASENIPRWWEQASDSYYNYWVSEGLLLSAILGVANARNLIFREKLNEFLDTFEAKTNKGGKLDFLEMQKVVNEKQSVQYLWPRNYKRSNIDSKKVAEFFKTYQPMRIQF